MGVDLLNIEGLAALDRQAPVVRSLDGDGSGWDAYLRYSALTVPVIKARAWNVAVDRQRQRGRAGTAGRQPVGLCGAGVLPDGGGVRRHDDVSGLRNLERSASPQRLR